MVEYWFITYKWKHIKYDSWNDAEMCIARHPLDWLVCHRESERLRYIQMDVPKLEQEEMHIISSIRISKEQYHKYIGEF